MAGLTDWAGHLLGGRRHAVRATQDEDGGAHLTPGWYLFRDGDCSSAAIARAAVAAV